MKKSELFTKEMLESFTCHPYAEAPRLSGSVIWFTRPDYEAECTYPDRGPCND